MKSVMIFIILSLAIPVSAKDKWTKEDTLRQLAFTIVASMDWMQAKEIARNPRYFETSPYLGKYPSQKKVNIYFASCLVGHALISCLLPSKINICNYKIYPRKAWQYFWIGVETGYVQHNLKIGIRIKF